MNPRTNSLWAPHPPDDSFPTLTRDAEVDVAIIGAGITGLTAALHLAEHGQRVLVLEARSIAGGATAATTAHITEAVDARYAQIERRFGREGARLVAASTRAANEHIAGRIERLAIACDFHRVPGYLYAENEEQHEALVAEHHAAEAAGLNVTLDPPLRLPFPTTGALRFGMQARFNPHDYVWALARAAIEQGVRIVEGSRVVDFTDGAPAVLHTDSGATVRAGAVFCATYAPLNKLFLQTKLSHHQTYVAAFRGPSLDDALYWDMADPYHYLRVARVDDEPYLLVGGEDHKTGVEEHTQIPFERLLVYCHERFGTDRPQFHWSGHVIESIDGLPLIGANSVSRNVYVATGFAGNGMTFGTLAGLLVSALVRGVRPPWTALYDATRIPLSAMGAFLRDGKDVPAHLIGDRLEPPEVRSSAEIERDQGRTMKLRGRRLAVYRDRRGVIHSLSGVCTHMGCLVKFNEAERSWDCPCHGSRYSIDGAVLEGPAIAPLEHVPLEEEPEAIPILVAPDPAT